VEYNAAALMVLGRQDDALAELTRLPAVELGARGYDRVIYWEVFDPVRRDSRFIKIMDELGVKDAHDRAQAWRAANRRTEDRGPALVPPELRRRELATDKNGGSK
jgi:hypothetical protein